MDHEDAFRLGGGADVRSEREMHKNVLELKIELLAVFEEAFAVEIEASRSVTLHRVHRVVLVVATIQEDVPRPGQLERRQKEKDLASRRSAIYVVSVKEVTALCCRPTTLRQNVPQIVELAMGVAHHREGASSGDLHHLHVGCLGQRLLELGKEEPCLDQRQLATALQPYSQARNHCFGDGPREPRILGARSRRILLLVLLLGAATFRSRLLGFTVATLLLQLGGGLVLDLLLDVAVLR